MKMQSDIPVRKGLGPESPVQRIFRNRPAVHGKKDPPPLLILPKRHILAEPAFHPAAFIVIAPRALLSEFIAMPETVHIE